MAHAREVREGGKVQRRQPGAAEQKVVPSSGVMCERGWIQRRQPGAVEEEFVAHVGQLRIACHEQRAGGRGHGGYWVFGMCQRMCTRVS